MPQEALPCIRCNKALYNVDSFEVANQPYGGTTFTSHGHYGSTIYDPMDGRYIEINVCDDCLKALAERGGYVLENRSAKPVIFEGGIIGFVKTPGREPTPWNPDLGHYDDDDVLELDREDLSNLAERYPEVELTGGLTAEILLQQSEGYYS